MSTMRQVKVVGSSVNENWDKYCTEESCGTLCTALKVENEDCKSRYIDMLKG